MRFWLVAIALLLSGCAGSGAVNHDAARPNVLTETSAPGRGVASPAATSPSQQPSSTGTNGPPSSSSAPTQPDAPEQAAPAKGGIPDMPPMPQFSWRTNAILNDTVFRLVLDPLGSNHCTVIINVASTGDDPGPMEVEYIEAGGGWGMGWSSSGPIARGHAGPIDSNSVLYPPGSGRGGYGGNNSTYELTTDKPIEVLVAAQTFAPFPEPINFYGIGDQSVLYYYSCQSDAHLKVEMGKHAGMWDESTLPGGVGASASAPLVRPFAEAHDVAQATTSANHTTVLAAVLLDNAAHLSVAHPRGTDDWLLLPLTSTGHRADDGPGAYTVTVDAVGTGYISGIVVAILSTSPADLSKVPTE